ncbi:MAG TPA: hypothetical protein VJI69_04340, partial [Bacteroidia bacterium]|nr:hypothetical protein [Bacteroidia bacterium]
MKNILYSAILLALFCTKINAQVDYPTQPKAGYYEKLKQMVMPLVPTETALISAKADKVPTGFKDTLLKYDWYEIASYYFFDKAYSTYFPSDLTAKETNQANLQFNFARYTAKGTKYEMSFNRYKNGSFKVTTTTFDENTAQKLIEIKMIPTKTIAKSMMVTEFYGEKESQQ